MGQPEHRTPAVREAGIVRQVEARVRFTHPARALYEGKLPYDIRLQQAVNQVFTGFISDRGDDRGGQPRRLRRQFDTDVPTDPPDSDGRALASERGEPAPPVVALR